MRRRQNEEKDHFKAAVSDFAGAVHVRIPFARAGAGRGIGDAPSFVGIHKKNKKTSCQIAPKMIK